MICVLFVEDEKYVADSLAALFRRNGIEAVSLPSAEEALGAPPGDVVVADLELPGLSQVELLRRIKERIGADLEAPRRVASENLDLKVRVKSFQRGLFIEALRRTGG